MNANIQHDIQAVYQVCHCDYGDIVLYVYGLSFMGLVRSISRTFITAEANIKLDVCRLRPQILITANKLVRDI